MDQSPQQNINLSWQDIRARIREVVLYLPHFLKNPVEAIKRVPSWDWLTVFIMITLLGAITSMLSGIVGRQLFMIVAGIIVGPVASLITSFVTAGFFYYAGLFILKAELEFRKIFIVVALAQVPAHIAGILSPLSRAVTPFCILITALLLTIGLVENFMLDKKRVIKLVGAGTAIILVFWIYSTLVELRSSQIKIQDYTPESLDQIHKELSEGK